MRKIIRGGTVVTAAGESPADVLIDGEEIVAVGALSDVEDAEVLDAAGCYVLPGLIDNHTHMAMPFGGTHSIDDYDTGTRAAAAGGTTCIVDFVIQQHAGGLRSSLEEWQERATAPRTSTTASTWRSRRPTRARSPTWSRWSRRASARSRSSSPTAAC